MVKKVSLVLLLLFQYSLNKFPTIKTMNNSIIYIKIIYPPLLYEEIISENEL